MLVLGATAVMFAADGGHNLFQKGLAKERVEADIRGTMRIYEQVIRENARDHKLAAQALFRIAECHLALGDKEARKAYERLLRDYPDQKEIVTQAQGRLAAMSGARTSGTMAKRLLCKGCGDTGGDLSPDGRWRAITDWNGDGDLAIRDIATGQAKRLMAKTSTWKESKAYVLSPVFSSDMRQIVYCWVIDEREGHVQLRVIPNDVGGKSRPLIDSPEYISYTPHAWSPDGKSILVTLQKPDQTRQIAWVSVADGGVKVLKSLEWRLRIPEAKLSPDGRHIVYSALVTNPRSAYGPLDSREQRIYVLAFDGSSETELVKTAGINKTPLWTTAGKHVLFSSDRSGGIGLWSIPVENGKPAGFPSLVSPQIGQIASLGMTRSGAYYYNLLQMGGEQVTVAALGPAASGLGAKVISFGILPAWSPDGKRLAFTRQRRGAGEDTFDLVVQSVETGEESIYSFDGIQAVTPSWMRDGTSLVVPAKPNQRLAAA